MISSKLFASHTGRNLKIKTSFILLCAYVFLLSCFTKKFAYIRIDFWGVPFHITEIILLFCLALRASDCIRAAFQMSRPLFIVFASFLSLGVIQTFISCFSLPNPDFNLVKILKDACIYFQGAWLVLALGFTIHEINILFCSALLGAGFAQFLGWLGFILFGIYTPESATLIGIPVGNEAVNTLYVLAFAVLPPWAASILAIPYGKTWLVQFLLYFKRTWVFSILLFSLPALYFANRSKFKKRILLLVFFTFLGVGGTWITIKYVESPNRAVSTHLKDELKKDRPALWARLFNLVFPQQSFEGESTQKSFSKKFFHGEAPKSVAADSHGLFAFRLHLWKQAWDGFLAKPLWGQGFGPRIVHTQVNGEIAYWDGNWFSGPHNSFLTVAFRMGSLGIFLLLALNLLLVREVWKLRRNLSSDLVIYGSAVINMNAFAFFNVALENPQSGIWYWFFMGALLVALKQKQKEIGLKESRQ